MQSNKVKNSVSQWNIIAKKGLQSRQPCTTSTAAICMCLFPAQVRPSSKWVEILTEKSNGASCTSKDTESTLVVTLNTVLDSADEKTGTGTSTGCCHTIRKGRSFREGLGDNLFVGFRRHVGNDEVKPQPLRFVSW